jgi:hypothetical protein
MIATQLNETASRQLSENIMSTTSIQELYVGYFGRAGDPAGEKYWLGQEATMTDTQISQSFAVQPETIALYPALATPMLLQTSATAQSTFINSIYQNLFGHAADPAGLAYWQGQLSSGYSPGLMIEAIINGASGTDVTAMTNRAAVAQSFTTAIANAVPPVTWSAADALSSRAILANVTSGTATVTATTPQIIAAVAADHPGGGAPPPGTPSDPVRANSFTLTTGANTIPGLVGLDGETANGQDVINGLVNETTSANSTLTSADDLHPGGTGNTLNVTYTAGVAADATNGASIRNVQTFNMTSAAAVTLNAALDFGLAAANNLGTGAVTVSGLATGASVGISGAGSGGISYAYTTPTDAPTINIMGGVTGSPNITATAGAPTTATISSTGSANTVGTIQLNSGGTGTVTSLVVNAATNLTAALTAADYVSTGAALTVSGAATSVRLGVVGDDFATINAAGLTGGLTVTGVGSGATKLTHFTGGGGNNTLDFVAGAIASSMTLNGGSGGANTLSLQDTTLTAPLAGINSIHTTNFQTLSFDGGSASFDRATITNAAFKNFNFNLSATGAVAVSDALATDRYSLSANASTVSLTANTSPTPTSLTLALNGGSSGISTTGAVADVNAPTFNLVSNGSAGTNIITGGLSAADGTTFTITGSEALSVTGVADTGSATGETVNASGLTGALTLDLTGATQKVNVTTGNAATADLTATAGAVINNFTLGTGADTLNFLTASAIGASQIGTGGDSVTGFNALNDDFSIGGLISTLTPITQGGTGNLLADLQAAIGGAGHGVESGTVDLITISSNADAGTYLLTPSLGGGSASLASTDTAIHLIGGTPSGLTMGNFI